MKKSKQKEQEKPKVNYGGYRTKYINCDCDKLENKVNYLFNSRAIKAKRPIIFAGSKQALSRRNKH